MPETITFQHYEVLVRDDGTPWELGRGAMGVTYKALDTNLRVPVALKVIHPRQLDSELVAQRFVREARAAARLRHPHIAAVYHLGQQAENWFYAMEFVAGDTAEALVKREGPLPEAVVLTLAIQAARALNAAAALGLVHRDIKPSNLMLTRDSDEWQLKLIDFGLARTFTGSEADEDLAAVTHSGFVGTPYYASPEQLEQKELDIRSDLYSLGVTMWFLLTGKVPFTGSVVSVLSQHLHKVPPFEQLDGLASAGLRGLIARMLEKDPAARPQSARDLRHELEHCADELPGPRARPAPRPEATAIPEAPSAAESAETMATPVPTAPAIAPNSSDFDPAGTVAEFGFGQLCRARERTSGRDFALLELGPQRGLDDASLAHLQRTIERAQSVEHQQVWKVHTLESDAAGLRLVMAWVDGYAWRDLLRRRRELEPAEAFHLLDHAALGIDAILAAGIDRPDVSLAGLWCEAPSADADPVNVKVSPLGLLRAVSLDATWIGEGTIAGPAAGSEGGTTGAIRSLAQVAYETLGGVVTASGFPPLPALSEGANKVLRTALRDPAQFASARALVEQLTRAHTEPTPIVTLRSTPTAAPIAEPAATQRPPEAPIWREAPPATDLAPSPPSAPSAPSSEKSADADEPTPVPASDETPPEAAPLAESTPTSWSPPQRSGGRGLAVAAGLALVIGGAWLALRDREDAAPQLTATSPTSIVPTIDEPAAVPTKTTPIVVAPPPPATPAPTATPAPSTPPPVAVLPRTTPVPATPPPAPSKAEVVRQTTDRAEDFRMKEQWENAAAEWLALRRRFPETPAAADLGLEQLFREVRWHYTKRNEQMPRISKGQVESLVPLAREAAQAGVPAAMMLLGQHFTPTDPREAIKWYEQAARSTPKAHTRIGLVLTAQKKPTTADIAEAWSRFQKAAEAGDLDGRIVVAENLIYGQLEDGAGRPHKVPGLAKDDRRAVAMLREVIDEANRHGSAPPFENAPRTGEATSPPPPDTRESQPNRAKVLLGSHLFKLEELKPEDRPAWYREESTTVDHGAQFRQWLTEASGDRAEALGLLAAAADQGIGGPKDAALARSYAQKGADRGDPLSMFLRATYLTGGRKPADMPDTARELMIGAAEKGDTNAQEFCRKAGIPYKGKPQP